jgi:hypothetical protein
MTHLALLRNMARAWIRFRATVGYAMMLRIFLTIADLICFMSGDNGMYSLLRTDFAVQ